MTMQGELRGVRWLGLWMTAGALAACSPSTQAAGTETDSEGDTEGTGTSTGGANDTLPDGGDPGDNGNGTNNDEAGLDDDPDDTTDDGEVDDTPQEDTAGDDGCPAGTEDCPCDVGASCEGELMCDIDSGTCVGVPECNDAEGEPNEDEDSAVELAELSCGAMPETTFGALNGVDLDMFSFHAVDDFVCFAQPEFTVTADSDVRACIFFECDEGDAFVTCPETQEPLDSPAGHPGCCGPNGSGFLSRTCTGGFGPETGTVYMRVSQADSEACLAYNIDYQF